MTNWCGSVAYISWPISVLGINVTETIVFIVNTYNMKISLITICRGISQSFWYQACPTLWVLWLVSHFGTKHVLPYESCDWPVILVPSMSYLMSPVIGLFGDTKCVIFCVGFSWTFTLKFELWQMFCVNI